MRTRNAFCLLLAAAVSPGACGRIDQVEKDARQIEQQIEQQVEESVAEEDAGALLRRADSNYLGELRDLTEPPPRLPPRVETRAGFSLATESSTLPEETVARITEVTGIPAVVTLDPEFGADRDSLLLNGQPLRYTGPLSGFLDQISAHWDAAWEYHSGVIRIENAVTKIYEVRASVAVSQFSLQTGDGNLGTGSISTELHINSTLWEEIESALNDLVKPGRIDIAPGTGLVSVTAPPSIHRKVATYIDRANQIFDARISIEIVAAFLDVTDLDDYGLSLNLLRSASNNSTRIALGRQRVTENSGFASFQVLDSATGGAARFSGSRALLQALSRSDRLVDYRTASAITRHGSPVPIRLARKQDIVRRVEVVVVDDSSTTSIESETLNTGLSMSAYPRILNQDRVHLTLSLVASDLVGLTSFGDGESGRIQLATVDERRLTHDLVLEPDETLLIAGYEQQQASIVRDGVGDPSFPLLGGGETARKVRTRLFLIVSANILR